MCIDNSGMTKGRYILTSIAILTKIIRSVVFNIFMLGLGFVLGFGTFKTIEHNIWLKNPNYECILRLNGFLQEQRVLDDKIDSEIKEIILRSNHGMREAHR